jgi:hypothetical protein
MTAIDSRQELQSPAGMEPPPTTRRPSYRRSLRNLFQSLHPSTTHSTAIDQTANTHADGTNTHTTDTHANGTNTHTTTTIQSSPTHSTAANERQAEMKRSWSENALSTRRHRTPPSTTLCSSEGWEGRRRQSWNQISSPVRLVHGTRKPSDFTKLKVFFY